MTVLALLCVPAVILGLTAVQPLSNPASRGAPPRAARLLGDPLCLCFGDSHQRQGSTPTRRSTSDALAGGDVCRSVLRHHSGAGHCRHPRGQAAHPTVGGHPADRKRIVRQLSLRGHLERGRPHLFRAHRSWSRCRISCDAGWRRLLNDGLNRSAIPYLTGETSP